MVITSEFEISPKYGRIKIGKKIDRQVFDLEILKCICFYIIGCKCIIEFIMTVGINELHEFMDGAKDVNISLQRIICIILITFCFL